MGSTEEWSFYSPQYFCPIPKPWPNPVYQEWLDIITLSFKELKFKQGIRGPGLYLGLKSWCTLFTMEHFFFKYLDFFFCTLVHRSALDFEPGTKRHNIWYPVQELLEMLPYRWAKPSQTHLWMEGLDREGKMAETYISPLFFFFC